LTAYLVKKKKLPAILESGVHNFFHRSPSFWTNWINSIQHLHTQYISSRTVLILSLQLQSSM